MRPLDHFACEMLIVLHIQRCWKSVASAKPLGASCHQPRCVEGRRAQTAAGNAKNALTDVRVN